MTILRITYYSILDDGDDCLIFVEEADFNTVSENLAKIFAWFGQEVKVENIARRLADVVFCQSKVVHNGDEWVMVRDWRKVLSQACCGTKHWNNPDEVRAMFGLVGACELALNAGVPILQDFALALVRMARGKTANLDNLDSGLMARMKAEYGDGWALAINSPKAKPITDIARDAFEQAFGVPDWQQSAIGEILSNWDLDSVNTKTVVTERDYTWVDTSSLSQQLPTIY